ncbi:dihydrolipoamide acetyltransferase family protein [Mycolicibacterium confluentis]|uniref:Dihydrolipoamide acetyltransferase component of pyruvate dehydrogenase complex n=1 Tax=Mycolicibacterium confluentis TaxID=28047 RepID=A0A7I7Y2A4_9MYCO|nr:dihydrolipoamide acetyltransferase family protein [Mycolicibacterium confluentis]MCV7320731.1 2-oxo acid dehydrogenase subunit E2 [Mycolicibacterium confluentis]ORV30364.1 branched-chain alpha-keto acid dehydrogenase subunit E2 [Mycolicibacterium confluentis]BBZ35778.1 dihydrolipoamide acetyltransferase component of pyruvate dehydrogenase complex [Mycolicibacterium confluentis]
MSDQTFVLPDLGEGLTDAVIADWLVAVGDTVTIDQPVVEVETAKASVEVPVPFSGTVVELHGDPGATLAVGAPLISVRPDEFAQHRNEERAGSGNVLIGYGTSVEDQPRRRRRRAPAPGSGTAAKVISPIVRGLALRNGVDLTTLSPSGTGGTITRADVERAIATPAPAPAHEHRIPVTGIRKAIADKLGTSRREIPDATTWVDADATGLLEARRQLGGRQSVSLLALLARLSIAALRQFPELNASFDADRQEILRHSHIHLGVAVQSPRGLVVPVLRHADALDTVTLSEKLAEATTSAREGRLTPAQMSGGTVTLNNYGVFGVDGSAAIINHPEAAILGVGRIIDRPWVVDGEVVVRKLTQLSLSFDHRVCDGGSAGGFLRLFADYVENPVAALGRL